MKRWVVFGAMGLAAAAGIVTPSAAQASSDAWYQTYQVNADGSFNSIAAISSTNIWAVADTFTKGHTVYQPFIRHFTSGSWQTVTIPHSAAFTSDWVSASSANNVWVGGLAPGADASSVVYRWNGSSWTRIPVMGMTSLQGVTVLAPNNVWAFGNSGTFPDDVFHWNGSKWQFYINNDTGFIPEGLSASAANNVWISGSKDGVAAYRWNGSSMNAVSMPHPAYDNAGPGVTAVSPTSVWIGWEDNTASHVMYWNGHTWSTPTVPDGANPLDIVSDGKLGDWFGPQNILTGSKWTTEAVPGFTGDLGDVTQIRGTTSFLMGGGVASSDTTPTKPTIFRFDL